MGERDRSFWRGVDRGFDKSFAPSMESVLNSALAERVRKKYNLDRDLLQEHEDERDTGMLQKLIETDADVATEEKEPLLALLRTNKSGKKTASAEERKLVTERYESLKKKKGDVASGEATKAAATQEVLESFQAQTRRIPADARDRFAPYLSIVKPTKADVKALEDDLKMHFDKVNATPPKQSDAEVKRQIRSQVLDLGENDFDKGLERAKADDPELYRKALNYGVKGSGSGSASRAADQPKTSKELLDKAYQDYRASMKDADELEVIAKLVGAETPAGAKRSFREYLTDWLPNVGRVFNAEVADSMEGALKSAQPSTGAPTGGTATGANTPATAGSQVPDDLVERARQALERIERQIQALEAKR